MSQYKVKEPPEKHFPADEIQAPQALFPEIFNISNLKTDKQIPILQFTNLQDTITTQEKSIDISVAVPDLRKKADLFLFVNHKKRDMYYQILGSEYTFKEVKLDKGENIIELFYRLGQKKSSSIYCLINRE